MPAVAALRRYPVKSMGGESLDSVALDSRGLVGDRWYAVVDEDGRFASGKDSRRFRRRDGVFGYTAATGEQHVVVSGAGASWHVGDTALDAHLSTTLGSPVRVAAEADIPHQDMGGVSLIGTATMAWCAEQWGGSADPRRIRPNVVLETDEPFEEERWIGSLLDVGTAYLRVAESIPRCRMIDIVQDGVVPGQHWLKPLAGGRDLCLGIYADVERPGVISVGDAVLPLA